MLPGSGVTAFVARAACFCASLAGFTLGDAPFVGEEQAAAPSATANQGRHRIVFMGIVGYRVTSG
jgi:hypothetical protein